MGGILRHSRCRNSAACRLADADKVGTIMGLYSRKACENNLSYELNFDFDLLSRVLRTFLVSFKIFEFKLATSIALS